MIEDRIGQPAKFDADQNAEQAVTRCESLALFRRLVPSTPLRIFFYFALWTVIALASGLHWWFFPQGSYPYTWLELIVAKCSVWYLWGAFVPIILTLAARYRLDSPKHWRNLAILITCGVVLTSLYICGYTAVVLAIIESPGPYHFRAMWDFMITMHSTWYFLAFWVVVGFEHSVAYYHRYIERERLAAELRARLTQAQFERLKNQLNPHFLFNTLNTVSSLVLSDQKSEAYDALADLAELLRISLDRNESQYVSLADELEFSRLYVDLMLRRFPERPGLDWRIDQNALSAEIPNMLLQPLIENALKHNIEASSHRQEVSLSALVDSGRLIIELRNPMTSSTRIAVREGFGIGLNHIRQRLQHHYGNDFQFEDSAQAGEFVVFLSIPMKESRPTSGNDQHREEISARSHRR